MGLLDKAGDVGSAKKPVAKAVPKAKPVAKAVPKAKAVAKAVPKAKAVAKAKVATPVPVAVEVAEPVAAVVKKARPQGLPENFEIASANARRIAWFTNFVVNLGPIFAFLFSVTILDAFTTIFALIALIALILNLIVVPVMSGRTLGNFVSRTKNVNSSGNKPIFLHALLVYSTGIFALMGLIFLMVNVQNVLNSKGTEQIWASVWSILGVIFIVLYFVNVSFKNSSALKQGLYDTLFGAYLVKHVPVAGEESTGIIAKLESMGTYGDRYSKRQAEKKIKREEKAKAAEEEQAILAESSESGADESDDSADDSADKSDSESEDKTE
ncbi:MAG: hypothetical protein DWC09_05650 [Candidatus Poseidoniales archaeon]|nr:MAG: hypothetical protein DWC09_05650 [Candidatus Poseidoniales archaeon]